MSDKMTCPGCDAHGSSVLHAFRQGDPCPHCGLSAGAAGEILAVRSRKADGELTARVETLIKERDEAQRQARNAVRKLEAVRSALGCEHPYSPHEADEPNWEQP